MKPIAKTESQFPSEHLKKAHNLTGAQLEDIREISKQRRHTVRHKVEKIYAVVLGSAYEYHGPQESLTPVPESPISYHEAVQTRDCGTQTDILSSLPQGHSGPIELTDEIVAAVLQKLQMSPYSRSAAAPTNVPIDYHHPLISTDETQFPQPAAMRAVQSSILSQHNSPFMHPSRNGRSFILPPPPLQPQFHHSTHSLPVRSGPPPPSQELADLPTTTTMIQGWQYPATQCSSLHHSDWDAETNHDSSGSGMLDSSASSMTLEMFPESIIPKEERDSDSNRIGLDSLDSSFHSTQPSEQQRNFKYWL